jgi:hypothetical protein
MAFRGVKIFCTEARHDALDVHELWVLCPGG